MPSYSSSTYTPSSNVYNFTPFSSNNNFSFNNNFDDL